MFNSQLDPLNFYLIKRCKFIISTVGFLKSDMRIHAAEPLEGKKDSSKGNKCEFDMLPVNGRSL